MGARLSFLFTYSSTLGRHHGLLATKTAVSLPEVPMTSSTCLGSLILGDTNLDPVPTLKAPMLSTSVLERQCFHLLYVKQWKFHVVVNSMKRLFEHLHKCLGVQPPLSVSLQFHLL